MTPDTQRLEGEGKPRLLDLFCGAGGAAMGYSRAGFEVVGVDIEPQPNYPFEFVEADALLILGGLLTRDYGWRYTAGYFAAIHASPPCQAYTTMNNRWGSDSPALIAQVREKLLETGLPYVIENVMGARSDLHSPVMLCGRALGIGTHRHRLFECSFPVMTAGCSRPDARDAAVYGKPDGRRLFTRADGTELRAATPAEGSAAMEIDWMTWDELREAIPPVYTETLGLQLIQQLQKAAA